MTERKRKHATRVTQLRQPTKPTLALKIRLNSCNPPKSVANNVQGDALSMYRYTMSPNTCDYMFDMETAKDKMGVRTRFHNLTIESIRTDWNRAATCGEQFIIFTYYF